MKKKEYIKPQIIDIECGVMTRLLDGSDIGEIEAGDNYKDEGTENDWDARRQRFDLENNINSLRGKNVWENEW